MLAELLELRRGQGVRLVWGLSLFIPVFGFLALKLAGPFRRPSIRTAGGLLPLRDEQGRRPLPGVVRVVLLVLTWPPPSPPSSSPPRPSSGAFDLQLVLRGRPSQVAQGVRHLLDIALEGACRRSSWLAWPLAFPDVRPRGGPLPASPASSPG